MSDSASPKVFEPVVTVTDALINSVCISRVVMVPVTFKPVNVGVFPVPIP